jgi:DNA-binding protein H-NS
VGLSQAGCGFVFVLKSGKNSVLLSGHDVEEIAELIRGRTRRTKAGASKSYATYVDPDNAANTYVRGPLPRWMRDKMTAAGLDLSNKEDRETFKQKHLKKTGR